MDWTAKSYFPFEAIIVMMGLDVVKTFESRSHWLECYEPLSSLELV